MKKNRKELNKGQELQKQSKEGVEKKQENKKNSEQIQTKLTASKNKKTPAQKPKKPVEATQKEEKIKTKGLLDLLLDEEAFEEEILLKQPRKEDSPLPINDKPNTLYSENKLYGKNEKKEIMPSYETINIKVELIDVEQGRFYSKQEATTNPFRREYSLAEGVRVVEGPKGGELRADKIYELERDEDDNPSEM